MFRANIDESVDKITQNLQKKKFEIIIPEIKQVAEIVKTTLEDGKAAPTAD